MPTLELNLLGRPQVKIDGALVELSSHKAQALLYYLAATRQPHSRQALAGLLWADLPEDAARRNLRVELLKLRVLFDPFLDVARDTLALSHDAQVGLDVTHFEHFARHQDPTPEQLQKALDLYQGGFLDDFHVREAPLFEEWVAKVREHLQQTFRHATFRLTAYYLQQRNYTAGIECINQLLGREPWLEEAHQQLMRLLARSGRRGEALAQYETCSRILNDEFGVIPSDETNALYDQIESGEEGADPEAEPQPLATPVAPILVPFQSPPVLLHFVGRQEQLTELQNALTAGDGAICALVGMGGVGKTTLTAHLAHAMRNDFPDGVLWAFSGNSEPLDILGGWAQALGYDFSSLSDVENRAAALRGVLAEKRVLLVVDDVRSAARVRPLLVGGNHCAALLTTRDLDVASALNADPYPLAELSPPEGRQLLMRILGEERVQAETAAATEICNLLHNLPLAVEITAQRLLSRPRRRLADMAQRLHKVEERLDLSISDRAVRTSFMVSWEALDVGLQRVFALLGVFEGRSFAAPALAHIAGFDVYTAEDKLFSLTALSLLSEQEPDRYRQHLLLADFAREKLAEDAKSLIVMAEYYQQFAQQNRTNYLALRPEWENMMAGMKAAYELQQWSLVIAYADTLTEPWFVRGRYTQARQGYAWACEAAVAVGDEQALARCLLKWGQACIEQDEYNEGEKLLLSSLKIFEKLGEKAGICDVYYYLAWVTLEQTRYNEVETFLIVSQQIREELNDRVGLANVYYQQAFLTYRRGYYEQTKILCEQALHLREQLGDQAGLLPTLRLLTDTAIKQEDFTIAEAYCKRALVLCDLAQDRGELAATYYSLTVVARRQENFDLAQSYAEKALALCQWIGNRRFQAFILYELSQISAKKGDLSKAIEMDMQSLQILQALYESYNQVNILRHLGDLYCEVGKYEKAQSFWQQALDIAEPLQHPLTDELQRRLQEK